MPESMWNSSRGREVRVSYSFRMILRKQLSSKLPVSPCSSHSDHFCHGPPRVPPFQSSCTLSTTTPFPTHSISAPWHLAFLQDLGEMENLVPLTPSDHISFIIFLMPREADPAIAACNCLIQASSWEHNI